MLMLNVYMLCFQAYTINEMYIYCLHYSIALVLSQIEKQHQCVSLLSTSVCALVCRWFVYVGRLARTVKDGALGLNPKFHPIWV